MVCSLFMISSSSTNQPLVRADFVTVYCSQLTISRNNMNTKVQTAIKAFAVTLALVLASGCASTERLNELETRVGAMEQDIAMAKSDAASAASNAQAAQASASAAQSAANASQSCCDATNEKIDRMFQSSQSK
jgi:outer membrane murein-binding lipoprotein Lpp